MGREGRRKHFFFGVTNDEVGFDKVSQHMALWKPL